MNESAGGRMPVPPAVWVFGLSTLIPSFISSALFCYGPDPIQRPALVALLAYSAAMVSYFGGVRTGLEIENASPRWSVLGISLLFPLAAFGLLLGELKFEAAWQLSGFLLLFLLQWVWDVTDHDGPSWRPRMRTLLTAGAAVSLAFSLEQALHM
jgi:hypothetical protein